MGGRPNEGATDREGLLLRCGAEDFSAIGVDLGEENRLRTLLALFNEERGRQAGNGERYGIEKYWVLNRKLKWEGEQEFGPIYRPRNA